MRPSTHLRFNAKYLLPPVLFSQGSVRSGWRFGTMVQNSRSPRVREDSYGPKVRITDCSRAVLTPRYVLQSGAFQVAVGAAQKLAASKSLGFALALASPEEFRMLWRKYVFLEKANSVRA